MTDLKISIIRIILCATIFVILIRSISIDIVGVHGTSMQPTLEPGQVVMVNRLAYGLQIPLLNRYVCFWHGVREGDIIVFESPLDHRAVVKRCIAVAGTPIHIEGDALLIENKAYHLQQDSIRILSRYHTVPNMTVLAIGDNPDRSIDSRIYGFVPVKNIRGRIIANYEGKRL